MTTERSRTRSESGADRADGSPQPPTRRGRPRSAEVDAAVLAATLELAGAVGIARLSMDEVAERAGVSKASIYRRWSSKEALVLDALKSAVRPFDEVDTGTLRGDLDVYLGELTARFERGRLSDVLPHLVEVGCHDDGIRASLDDYIRFRRRPLRAILERGRDRGELDVDVDVDVLIDVLIGPFVYRRLLSRGALDTEFVDRLLAVVLPGV